jgi:hypothetical protein
MQLSSRVPKVRSHVTKAPSPDKHCNTMPALLTIHWPGYSVEVTQQDDVIPLAACNVAVSQDKAPPRL